MMETPIIQYRTKKMSTHSKHRSSKLELHILDNMMKFQYGAKKKVLVLREDTGTPMNTQEYRFLFC